MKTMDAGRVEVEYAAKAGADVVGVLGAASDSTIKECVEAARNYGCKFIVDMIEVADPVARAQARRGARRRLHRHPHRHRPADARRGAVRDAARRGQGRVHPGHRRRRDQQRDGGGGRRGRRRASSSSAAPSSRRPTPHRRAAEIRRAVDEGRLHRDHALQARRRGRHPRRVLEQVSTANISDAWHRQPSLHGIKPLLPGAHMCGPAVTVRTYPATGRSPSRRSTSAGPATSWSSTPATAHPAIWGELATHSASVKG